MGPPPSTRSRTTCAYAVPKSVPLSVARSVPAVGYGPPVSATTAGAAYARRDANGSDATPSTVTTHCSEGPYPGAASHSMATCRATTAQRPCLNATRGAVGSGSPPLVEHSTAMSPEDASAGVVRRPKLDPVTRIRCPPRVHSAVPFGPPHPVAFTPPAGPAPATTCTSVITGGAVARATVAVSCPPIRSRSASADPLTPPAGASHVTSVKDTVTWHARARNDSPMPPAAAAAAAVYNQRPFTASRVASPNSRPETTSAPL